MKNYKMIIYGIEAQEGIQYVAEYPALKGVSGTGIDPEHAMRDLEINSTVNLEALREANLPIPESDLLIQTKYSGKLSLRLSKRLHAQVARAADVEGVSINQYIVEAVAQAVGQKNSSSGAKRNEHKSILFVSES
jgi:predicted RNase H-like HicB family nuclease